MLFKSHLYNILRCKHFVHSTSLWTCQINQFCTTSV